MFFKKYALLIFRNKNDEPNQYKNTRKLNFALACWVLGEYPIEIFPALMLRYKASLEILVPVILVTIFLTVPLTFLEMGFSQYARRGCIKIWDAVPVWRGIGIVGLLCLYITFLYETLLCNYFLIYTIRSVTGERPWLNCEKQDFRRSGCYTYSQNRTIHLDCIEAYGKEYCSSLTWHNSAEAFWNSLHKSNINALYIFFVLVIVYITVRSSCKSLQIFAPIFVVVPLLIQGILITVSFLHPGTAYSLKIFADFKFGNLFSLNVWTEVTVLSLYSVGYAYGGLSTFARHQDFRNATHVQAVFANVASVTYSLLYSIFWYNICGILSYELNIPAADVLKMSERGNFIQCPLGFSYLKLGKFLTFLFYFSNFATILRNLATKAEVVLDSALYDLKPILSHFTIPCALTFCVLSLCLNLFLNFEAAHEFFYRSHLFIIFILSPLLTFYSSLALFLFYGVKHFVSDMHFMLGFRPATVWQISWYLGSIVYFAAFVNSALLKKGEIDNLKTGLKYPIILFLTIAAFIPVVYFFVILLLYWQKNVRILDAFKPLKNFGPKDEILRKSRDLFSAHDMTKEYLYRQQRLKFKPETRIKPSKTVEFNVQ